MGEYVNYKGESIKIGTCESLYYTTLEQFRAALPDMTKESGNLSPEEYLNPDYKFRFRFPFPDEKNRELGNYDNYDRGYLLSFPRSLGVTMCHDTMFFRTDEKVKAAPAIGFRLPCPSGDNWPRDIECFDWSHALGNTILEVVRQGIITSPDEITPGAVVEVQTIVRCPYCGSLSRLSREEAQAIADYYEKKGTDEQKEITRIILDGYLQEVTV